jgi:cytochrome c peroxidase
MKQTQLAVIGGVSVTAALAMVLTTHIVHGQTAIPPFSICSQNVDVASLLPGGAHEDPEVATAGAFITLTEQTLLQQVAQAPSLDQYHQITLLGKTEIYDVTLSPLNNTACATCHAPYTGFRGSTSIFNATTAAQAGGIPITNATPPEPNYRFGPRNPQTSPRSCTTTQRKTVSMAAISGICAPLEFASPIQRQNRHKDRR